MEQFEKVVKGLECISQQAQNGSCGGCAYFRPFTDDPDCGWCEKMAIEKDALALIRQQQERIAELETGQKQEPALLENQHKPYGHFINANSPWISRCPKCGKKVEGKQTRYCKYCGQAVKWE